MGKKSKLRSYPSKYRTRVDPNLNDKEWRKARTIELYSYLPQTTLEDRYRYVDIRDEVIFLNYQFFGYVAANVFLKDKNIPYEDKFQSALTNFCYMWHKYKFEKPTKNGHLYRTDLSFSVFFKQRLSECVSRELNSVKRSSERALRIEAAEELGIPYTTIKYDDLSNLTIASDKIHALRTMLRSDYTENVEDVAMYMQADDTYSDEVDSLYSDDYNSICDMLVHEMVEKERMLVFEDFKTMSVLLGIDVEELLKYKEEAESKLYKKLTNKISLQKSFIG